MQLWKVFFVSFSEPTTPSNLETANVGTTTLTLSWTASACQGATQTFTVRDADDTIPTGGNSVSVSSASLTELTPGKSYTFTVIATCGGQTGDTGSGKTESLSKFNKCLLHTVTLIVCIQVDLIIKYKDKYNNEYYFVKQYFLYLE